MKESSKWAKISRPVRLKNAQDPRQAWVLLFRVYLPVYQFFELTFVLQPRLCIPQGPDH